MPRQHVIFEQRSTNRQWGLAIVGPEGTEFPAQGTLRHLGQVAGVSTYVFEPAETGQWVMPVSGSVKIHGGAASVEDMSLQSHNYVTLLVLASEAVIEVFGYRRRSSTIYAYRHGREEPVPAEVLAAMGLIQGDGEIITIPQPAPMEGAMALAFAKAKGEKR